VKRLLKILVWLIVLGGLGALLAQRTYVRYQAKQAQTAAAQTPAEPEAVHVVARPAEARDLRDVASLTGTVRPMAEVRVMSKVSGRLEALRLPDGTPVDDGTVIAKAGTPVAVIDHAAFDAQVHQAEAALAALRAEQAKMEAGARPEELEIARANVRAAEAAVLAAKATVAQAKAALENATSDVERVRNLYKASVVTKQQLDGAEAQFAIAREKHQAAGEQVRGAQEQLRAAREQLALTDQGARKEDRAAIAAKVQQTEAALRLAQITLDESTIEAPIAGVVTHKHLDEGNMVSPATPIVTVVQVDTVKVVVGVNERDVALVRPGVTQVVVRLDAYPDQAFTGTVKRVCAVADEQTRTIDVEIHVPNPGRRLKPGMFARIDLVLREKKAVVAIPEDILLRTETETYVYVVNDSTAHRRPVKLGLSEGPMIEVTEGLEAGEIVVHRGQRRLRDGTPVEQVEQREPTP